MDFVHLHNHTMFSILDGVASPESYFQQCAERKYPAFAITEHGVLSSIPDAYIASKETGVKYIAGCEMYYCDYELTRQKIMNNGGKLNDLKDGYEELLQRIRRNRHLTVLCKNEEGYQNLLKINKHAWEFGFYYRPRTWFDILSKHSKGLIILSGCLNGVISHEIVRNNISSAGMFKGALEYIKKFKNVFGDDFYIELQMPDINIGSVETPRHDSEIFGILSVLAHEYKIKMVICNDCHYIKKEDFEIQKIMMAIDQGTTVDDPELFHVNSNEQYMKTRDELKSKFIEKYSDQMSIEDFDRACDTTIEVAEKCNSFQPDLSPKLPVIVDEEHANKELVKLTLQGLRDKGFDKDKTKFHTMDGLVVTYREQMVLELDRIINKGFASYFLITRDLVRHSTHTLGWPIGPSRGSAGGSLVCFLIGINYINPLLFKLSFDRFLSNTRGGWMLNVSMDTK